MKLLAAFVCGLALICGTALGLRYWRTVPLAREHGARARRVPLHLPLVRPHIVVSKSERELRLYSGVTLLRIYRVALGQSPVEDKEREGDKRTPEGDFYVTARNSRSHFYRSLGLSYPNLAATNRGLQTHLISQKQYDQIVEANRRHRNPPQNTPLGGKVLIHGGGSERDWTFGCVALDNPEMLELFSAVPVNTPVTIEH